MKKRMLAMMAAGMLAVMGLAGCEGVVTTSETANGGSTAASDAGSSTDTGSTAEGAAEGAVSSDTTEIADAVDLQDYVVPANPTGKSADEIKIGLSFAYTDADEFTVAQYTGAQDEAEAQGTNLYITDAHSDEVTQANDVLDLIQQGMDVIGIYPVNGEMISSSIEACNEAGIPVFLFSTPPATDEIEQMIDGFSGGNAYRLGEQMAQTCADALGGEGKVIELAGLYGMTDSDLRCEATRDVFASYPGIEIIDSQEYGWAKEEAITVVENLLIKYPEVDAIVCANDSGACGAISALEAVGRLDEVKVFSCNMNDEGYEAIKEGKLYSSGIQDASEEGHEAVKMALDIALGNEYKFYGYTSTDVVTQENVGEFETPGY
ncbi:MAG: sugar ABC transporter substrate-binding protein [Roseburia sp.]|nr:sugar ABC transporter substrate-binding protein [Roseburia sp.]